MSPLVQRWLTIAILLAATLYLSRRGWRSWRAASRARRDSGGGCGTGCGCG